LKSEKNNNYKERIRFDSNKTQEGWIVKKQFQKPSQIKQILIKFNKNQIDRWKNLLGMKLRKIFNFINYSK
jgi:hypothetical protein